MAHFTSFRFKFIIWLCMVETLKNFGLDPAKRQWKKKKGKLISKYLPRYLHLGFISEKNIIAGRDGRVTFRYIDSETKSIRYRTLNGEDFLRLILQHVLPRGFRRTRDYGFLNSNAKKIRSLVQLILYVLGYWL